MPQLRGDEDSEVLTFLIKFFILVTLLFGIACAQETDGLDITVMKNIGVTDMGGITMLLVPESGEIITVDELENAEVIKGMAIGCMGGVVNAVLFDFDVFIGFKDVELSYRIDDGRTGTIRAVADDTQVAFHTGEGERSGNATLRKML